MRKKKVEGQMMEQAIEKASQLIMLLQKENKDVKKRNEILEGEVNKIKKDDRELQRSNDLLTKQIVIFQDKHVELQKELEESRQAVHLLQESLNKKSSTNKQLHEKISIVTAKLKQKTRECSEQKTKVLSLQNENEYLIKRLSECDEKENQIRQKITSSYSNREQQLKQAVKLKEAFSRRCEELKADNQTLIQAAAEYKQRALNKQVGIAIRPPLKQIVEEQVQFVKAQEGLLLKLFQKLGLEPEKTVQKQFDQISSFIDYRLSHIDKLWQGISTKLELKQWSKLQNLKDLQSSVQRIFVYLSEVLTKAS